MKTSVVLFVILCGLAAGGIVYLNHHKVSPSPAIASQVPETAATPPQLTATKAAVSNPDVPAKILKEPEHTATPVAQIPANDNPVSKTNSVDTLLSAKSGAQKHELFQQLVQSGQIDQVIAELKQRAMENTNDAEIPTTLGEAQLNKLRALHDAGSDNDDLGILAMQADQSFNAALKIDPSNWEAQFVKVSSMYYWPSDPTRDNEVVQRLSNLIDQQETMSTQPQFAQTYVVLGNEYQKIGQPDKAMATWQIGAQKFPNDQSLQKKLSGP
jgi:hypothetical protein